LWLLVYSCRFASVMKKKLLIIEYCPKCNWLLRAAYMAQEFLTTFESELEGVMLKPGEVKGDFHIRVGDKKVFDRKEFGGFPEIKKLKQLIRDQVAPGKNLGHADTPSHHNR